MARTSQHHSSDRSPSSRDGRSPTGVHVIATGRRFAWGEVGGIYRVWDRRGRIEPLEHELEANAEREFLWLEHDESERRRRRRRRVALLVVPAVALIALATAVGVARLAADRAAADVTIADGRYVERTVGYSIDVPDGWTVTPASGASGVTVVERTDGGASIRIEPRAGTDAEALAALLEDELATAWTEVQLEDPRPATVAGFGAIRLSGQGVALDGTPIRFTSFAVDAGDGAYELRVWVPRSWDAAGRMPEIEQLVGSFRPGTTG